MNSNTNCQAAIPAKCRYHSPHSAAYTKVLQQKMVIAVETYKAVKQTSEAYNAYATMRNSQKEYFSTDQGLQELEATLKQNHFDTKVLQQLEEIQKQALEERSLHEANINSDSPMIFGLKPWKVLPEANTDINEDDLVNLSTFSSSKGAKISINFVPSQNIILCTDEENNVETIGAAATITEATFKATHWYNRNK